MSLQNSFTHRKNKLKNWLIENKGEGCFIQDPVNLFYYTGLHLSAGILVFTPKKQVLVVDLRYAARCQKEAPYEVEGCFSLSEGLKKISYPQKMIVDGQTMTHFQFKALQTYAKIRSKPGFLMSLRMQKDASELKKIKKSCQIALKGNQMIKRHLKPGVTEQEIALKLEMFFRKEGAEKVSFDPIVAFGPNSANPHYSPGKVKLKKNDIVLIDSGCVYEGYCSDMTRTYLMGKVSPKLQKIHAYVETIQQSAIEMCAPGVALKKVDQAVKSYFKEHQVQELFIHGLGHGVGIEIHEEPRYTSKGKMQEGMVLTVEPGLYIDGLGGVRIEDTIVLTSKGYEILTR